MVDINGQSEVIGLWSVDTENKPTVSQSLQLVTIPAILNA